jgi:hypothetical protein
VTIVEATTAAITAIEAGTGPIFAGSVTELPTSRNPGHVRIGSPSGTIVDVLALVWYDVVGLILIVAACGGLYYLSSRIEPHWVAKDQSRFLTVAQELDQRGLPIGRRRDVRVHIDEDGDALLVSGRSRLRGTSSVWTIKSKTEAGRSRNVYVLRPASPSADAAFLALRVPQRSKVVPRLDAMLELTGDDAAARRERARYRADLGLPSETTEASGSPGSPPPDPPTDPD